MTVKASSRFSRPTLTALVATILLGGCAAIPGLEVPPPTDVEAARGVPGFDTRDYPGDAAMRTWREHSPYRWVGYYLEAPCYTGTTWNGVRERLEAMGWGQAVLFVGEQDWAEIVPADQVVADPTLPRCTRANLHGERGGTDAAAAVAAAAGQGFPSGTVIYLNVERVENISSDLRDYLRAWTAGVLADGRYVPGMYAHAHNAQDLHGVQRQAFSAAGRGDEPRLWVATTRGFDLRRAPDESGFPAWIWQGVLDTHETWGGVRLFIDANVARSSNPSGR
jgi:hypothetical protein